MDETPKRLSSSRQRQVVLVDFPQCFQWASVSQCPPPSICQCAPVCPPSSSGFQVHHCVPHDSKYTPEHPASFTDPSVPSGSNASRTPSDLCAI